MVNAILDYVLLLDRLVIKWFIYVAEHDYYKYFLSIAPLIIIPLLDIIHNKYENIQCDDILKNYNINELAKVMNDSGYTYDEIREAFNEEEIEWLKM